MGYPITDIQGIGAGHGSDPEIGRDTHHNRPAAHAPKPPSSGCGSPRRPAPTTRACLIGSPAADRMRVKGVGCEYSEFLRAAGVRTVAELKFRNPQRLVEKMQEANTKRKLVRLLPSVNTVARWIEIAKKLPPIVRY